MGRARPCMQLTGLGYGRRPSNEELNAGQLYAALSEVSCTGKSIAVYHDRNGDQKSMLSMDIDVDTKFWHTVDSQFMAHHACGSMFDQKPGLTTAADCFGHAMTDQEELKDGYGGYAPIHHNAQDDAFVTLGITIELLKLYAEENNLPFPPQGGNATLVSIDFEGAGYNGTSEIGVATISMDVLRNVDIQIYSSYFKTSHVILEENLNNHPCRGAMQKMGIDSKHYATYPRWNTRSGPSGTKKVKRSFPMKRGGFQHIRMSPDTMVLPLNEAKKWLAKLIAAAPAQSTTTSHTTSISGTQMRIHSLSSACSAQTQNSQICKTASATTTRRWARNKVGRDTGATSSASRRSFREWEM